jgi:hypothetical protein
VRVVTANAADSVPALVHVNATVVH